jgi:hypothetical protein
MSNRTFSTKSLSRGTTKARRRQNHSCDQCYRGKRACDASGRVRGEVCSSCARIGKQCTFEKLQWRSWNNPSESIEKEIPWRVQGSNHIDVAYPRTTVPSLSPLNQTISLIESLNDDHAASASSDQFGASTSHAPEYFGLNPQLCWTGTEPSEIAPSITQLDFCFDQSNIGLPVETHPLGVEEEMQDQQSDSHCRSETTDSMFLTDLVSDASDYIPWSPRKTLLFERDEIVSSLRRPAPLPSPSSDSLTYLLADKTNKSLISQSLMGIYHDTIENALGCWLTERTCPYSLEGIFQSHFSLEDSWASEWGPSWTNRFIKRICQLDSPSCVLRERPLTQWESKMAGRALKAAIMAFASQWSHSETDKTINFDIGIEKNNEDCGLHGEKGSHFERSLQELLWEEAHKALQETSGLDSFRVIFAQVIFTFTQKPIRRDTARRIRSLRERYGSRSRSISEPCGINDNCTAGNENAFVYGAAIPNIATYMQDVDNSNELQELQDLLEIQGPPTQLETAFLNLSAKRAKLEHLNTETSEYLMRQIVNPVEVDDRKTFNHLFWMVMMCDTLSATINKRSLIVSDEDSLILRPVSSNDTDSQGPLSNFDHQQDEYFPSGSLATDDDKLKSTPWDSLFLKSDSYRTRASPFALEDAAVLLADAAPVKVLLFRKVKQLENFYFRRASAKKLEAAIHDALRAYEHWNNSYGIIMAQCIKHHEALPSRVQSWYSILVGHWHLAAFLLADSIDKIDRSQRGENYRSALRQSCRLVFEIRKHSAFQMADLGRVGRSRYDSSFHHKSGLHFAVSQGALLTEPWTEIMIRSFAKACDQFLRWLSDCQSHDLSTAEWWHSEGQQSLNDGCNHCIRALFDLGRKSDMSYLAALSFSVRLQQLDETSNIDV